MNLRNCWRTKDETGASAVEYGLLVVAIAAVIVTVVVALGSITKTAYTNSCQKLTTQISGTCP